MGVELDRFPSLASWFERLSERPPSRRSSRSSPPRDGRAAPRAAARRAHVGAAGLRTRTTTTWSRRGSTDAARRWHAWADSVAAEVDGELVLVGASMGGYCALALAPRAPERVRGLLLVGSRPDADSDERRAGRAETIDLIRREGPDGLWRSMRPRLFADESHADERLLFRDADGLVGAVEAIRDREDSTQTARALGDRLRFVVGESDPLRLGGGAGRLRRPRARRGRPSREPRAAGRVQPPPARVPGACLSSRRSSTCSGCSESWARRISSSATCAARTRTRAATSRARSRSSSARRHR